MNFNLSKIKKVHCIGIGGIAVSADAKFLIGIGKTVTGSDAFDSEIVREVKKKGAIVYIGHNASNIDKYADLVIYSPAVPFENVERAKARKLGIREMSHTEFLGYLSRQMKTVAISGTNGKSTTTAMLGLIFEKAGVDPTVIVGSKVPGFEDGNLKLSSKFKVQSSKLNKDDIFVVEGCEYKAGMLELNPEIIVLTNIEEDHLDYYKNLKDIKRVFRKYVKKVERGGAVIYNLDDRNSVSILRQFRGKKIWYGVEKELRIKNQELSNKKLGAELRSKNYELRKRIVARDLHIKNQKQIFTIFRDNEKLGEIRLQVPGMFNVYNALAAATAAFELGVEFKIIKKALEEFKGIWRRFEIVGDYNGAVIISDYAHHPTAIRGTIQAAREVYPKRRIIAVFQPHSHNRTRKLFTEFVESFHDADLVILSEVYDVEGRESLNDRVSSLKLAEAIKERKNNCRREATRCLYRSGEVWYAKNLEKTGQILRKNIRRNDVVLLMGAGDIYKLKV
ncbi:MAG: UDP-N-acetylmuramate--L-alanine ligase [bacterium]